MKKNTKIAIIVIAVIVCLLIMFLISLLIPKNYTLKYNKNVVVNTNLTPNKENTIGLTLQQSGLNIVLNDFNINNIIYILRDNNNRIIDKGIIYKGADTTIYNVEKGKYNLSFIYKGKRKVDLTGNIILKENIGKEYSTLLDGHFIKYKIHELAGVDIVYNYTIEKIKVADTIDEKYKKNENIVSTIDSPKPIYMWFEDNILFFYSDNGIAYSMDVSGMFAGLKSLIDAEDLKYFKADSIVEADGMFEYDEKLSDVRFLAYYKTPNLKSASKMFKGCYSLMNIDPMISLDMSKIEDISYIISETKVNDISIFKYFDTKNIKNIEGFLYYTDVIDLTALENWNTSSVYNMNLAFGSTDITNLDAIKNWDTSNVTTMLYIFSSATRLKNIDGISNWNTKNLEHFSYGLEYTDITTLDALKNWNTDRLVGITGAFTQCRKLKNIDGISNWNTSNVQNFNELFEYTNIEDISSLKNWNTSNVNSMDGTFSYTKIKSLKGLEKWDTSNVTSFKNTFRYLKAKDVSAINNWHISNGVDFDGIFEKSTVKPNWNGTWNEDGTFVK